MYQNPIEYLSEQGTASERLLAAEVSQLRREQRSRDLMGLPEFSAPLAGQVTTVVGIGSVVRHEFERHSLYVGLGRWLGRNNLTADLICELDDYKQHIRLALVFDDLAEASRFKLIWSEDQAESVGLKWR